MYQYLAAGGDKMINMNRSTSGIDLSSFASDGWYKQKCLVRTEVGVAPTKKIITNKTNPGT